MESGFLKQNRSFKGKDRKKRTKGCKEDREGKKRSKLGCKVVEEGEQGNRGGVRE